MINLTDYKNLKKVKLIVKDLKEVEKRINSSIKTFEAYSKYIPVAEILAVLNNNKTIIDIHLNKYNKLVEQQND